MKKTKSGNVAERAAAKKPNANEQRKAERKAVNALLNALRKKYKSQLYIFVDRDAGEMRHTKSPWDFLLARGPYVVFVEAKVGAGRLEEWQEYSQAEVKAAGGRYLVARFSEDGQRVSVDGGPSRAVAGITTTDFFRGGK
jgi:hypothetical protein